MKKDDTPNYALHPHLIGLECLVFNVRKTARILARAYDEALAPLALKSTQFSMLVGLSARGPLAMKEFAELLKMERTTLTRNLRPLERRGLVAVRRGADRRSRLLELTDQGRKTLAEAIPHWEGLQRRLTAEMGSAEASALRKRLHALSKLAGK